MGRAPGVEEDLPIAGRGIEVERVVGLQERQGHFARSARRSATGPPE
jgi:hypothetical protein